MKSRLLAVWRTFAAVVVVLFFANILAPAGLAQEEVGATPVPVIPGDSTIEPIEAAFPEEPAGNSEDHTPEAAPGEQMCSPAEDPSCVLLASQAPMETFPAADILVSHAAGDQQYPDTAVNLQTNEALVVWQDNRSGRWQIYAQRVNNQGQVVGAPVLVSDSTDPQRKPKTACEPVHGRWLVVWQQDASPSIMGRLITSDGAVEGSPFSITSGTLARTNPDVAYNPISQQFLAVWEYALADGTRDIWGRQVSVSADGTVSTGPAIVVSDLTDDESVPAAVANPLSPGDYLVVWVRDLAGDNNVIGRRVHADGSLTGYTIFRISPSDAIADENQPAVTVNSQSGAYLVAWKDTRQGAANADIYARLVSSSGTVGASAVVDSSSSSQERPALSYNPSTNQYLAAWEDGDMVFAQRINASLALLGSKTYVSMAGAVPIAPTVAWFGSGFWISWHDLRTSKADVYGRLLDTNAAVRSNEANLSLADGYTRGHHDLAFTPVGQRWLVVWAQDLIETPGEYDDILGQFVDVSGRLEGEAFAICHDPDEQDGPRVVYNLVRDEFLVAWADSRNGSRDIYAQRLDADGTLLGSAIQVTTNTKHQEQVSLAYDAHAVGGQYLLAWTDSRNDPGNNSNTDIYGRRIRGDGSFVDGGDFPISFLTGRQEAPAVTFNPIDRQYLAAWRDNTGDGRVAAQRIGEGIPALQGNMIVVSGETGASGVDVAADIHNGIYLVVWSTSEETLNTADIHGRLVDGRGAVLSFSDIIISNTPGGQRSPSVDYSLLRKHYYSAWVDDHIDRGDVDGQAVSTYGSLLFTPPNLNNPIVSGAALVMEPQVGFSDGAGLLVAWGDRRADLKTQIYALLGQANSMNRLYLPYTVQN